MKHLLSAIMLFVLLQQAFALQNKYALLIGINQYQKKDEKGKIVLDKENELFGCVNDAESMKSLLVSKFNFPAANIITLYDTEANRNNIFKQLDILNAKCKSGDVAVVYYAGHGMPFRYGENNEDIAEVILPSNAFTTVPYSYIQQTELAQKFNLFVDRNIMLTAIFDCCFSLGTDRRGAVMVPENSNDTSRFNVNMPIDSNWKEPVFYFDANEFDLLNNQDSVEETTAENYIPTIIQNRGLSLKQYAEMTKNILPYGFKQIDTTYDPPSQRDNSPFIFFSATNDRQTAPEIRDEKGIKHGAFTSALLKVYENNPATISFKEAFNKTTKQLKAFGKNITPSARYKPEVREEKNMLGIKSGDIKLKIYLPVENYTFNDLNAMYKKWVKPLNTDAYKSQVITKNDASCSKIYIMNKGKNALYIDAQSKKMLRVSNVDSLKKYLNGKSYFIYLPLPESINDSIRKKCLKNNKIQLVEDANKADIAFYCTNYSAPQKGMIDKIMGIGKSFLNLEYKDELVFVGSNETVGAKRNKPGHYFSVSDDVFTPAGDTVENIFKKLIKWIDTKSGE